MRRASARSAATAHDVAAVGRARRARRRRRSCGRPGVRPIVQETPLANAQFSRFTDWEGTEGGAEISPDGKFVAFIADRDGAVRPLGQPGGHRPFSQPHRRTPAAERSRESSGPSAFPATARRSGSPRRATSSAPKWLIPLTGGTPRAFLGEGDAAPSWSPDDTRLAYFTNGDGDPFSLADRPSCRRATARCRRARLFRKRHAQPQSGLVTGWPVDLLRARPGTDRRDERVARSTLGRHAGATDRRCGQRRITSRRSTRARCSMSRARRTDRDRGCGRSTSRPK